MKWGGKEEATEANEATVGENFWLGFGRGNGRDSGLDEIGCQTWPGDGGVYRGFAGDGGGLGGCGNGGRGGEYDGGGGQHRGRKWDGGSQRDRGQCDRGGTDEFLDAAVFDGELGRVAGYAGERRVLAVHELDGGDLGERERGDSQRDDAGHAAGVGVWAGSGQAGGVERIFGECDVLLVSRADPGQEHGVVQFAVGL